MGKKTAVVLIVVISTVAGLLLAEAPFTKPFGLKSLDMQFRLLARPEKADQRIVLIEVDQASLDHFEKDNIAFPWPRSIYNPLIQYCTEAGARAVLFDILFNNLSPYGEGVDQEFSKAITASERVYLAAAVSSHPGPAADGVGVPLTGDAPPALQRESASLPLPRLLTAARGVGSVSHGPDPDGVYRRVKPAVALKGRLVPALFAAPHAHEAGSGRWTQDGLDIGEHSIPLDEDGATWINYHGPRGSYRRYSAAAVIRSALAVARGEEPLVPADAFRDAYVLVGYTAPGLFDLKPTPLSGQSPGTEIHAAALDNLLNGDFLQRAPSPWPQVMAAIGALAVSIALVVMPSLSLGSLSALLVIAAVFAAALVAFTNGYWLNLVTVHLPAVFAFVGTTFYRYQVADRHGRLLRKAFEKFVSAKVVAQIEADPDRLKLGGEQRELTVFFSDLVGFTSLSEQLSPEDLVQTLNQYTTMMSNAVFATDGTVDKYIGDAVMAFWGAPLDKPDQARCAVLAALESMRQMEKLRDEVIARGLPHIDMRIGIAKGQCVAGNMGSMDRFDYTAIGDTVNLASRLEGLNKGYGTHILVGEVVWQATNGAFYGRVIDSVKVKGKEIPVRVFEPMAESGHETEEQKQLKRDYEAGLEAYMARRWNDAEALFDAILAERDDGPAKTLIERVRQYRQDPPPPDWDGSDVRTTK